MLVWIARISDDIIYRYPARRVCQEIIQIMKISVSSDEYNELVEYITCDLEKRNHQFKYFGPEKGEKINEDNSWPDVTLQAVETVIHGDADEAIIMCWTGTGATLVANKLPGIRAALCHDAPTAKGARIWNHANVLALSLRLITPALAEEILSAWFNTPVSKDEWNLKQIARVRKIEETYLLDSNNL